MIPRSQLPVHSPLTLRALVAGLGGALGQSGQSAISERIRAHFEAADVLLTSSGTTALSLAIRGAVRKNPGTVALPAYACYDLATAAQGADSKVFLYDVNPATLAPEPDSFARALSHKPDAVVLVHLYGVPVHVRSIMRDADAGGVIAIEDAAQAFGARVQNMAAGTLGSVSILSFGRGKGLTGGAGGALLAHDPVGVEIVRRARQHVGARTAGWSELVRSAAQWLLARPEWYELPANLPVLRLGETIFHQPEPPRQLSNVSAQMLREVWLSSVRAVDIRRANAARLRAVVESARTQWQPIDVHADLDPSYLRFPVISRSAASDVIDTTARRLGISRGYPLPLVELDPFRERCVNAGEAFPGAKMLARHLITLPTHGLLTESDLIALENWLRHAGASAGQSRESL